VAIGVKTVVYPSASFTFGNHRCLFRQVQLTDGTNHYTTGGIALPARDVGMKFIDFAIPLGPAFSITSADSAYLVTWHSQLAGNVRMHVYEPDADGGALVEVAEGTNLGGYFQQTVFVGR
jgi:hypothetical protein